jgi:hypothetical protein
MRSDRAYAKYKLHFNHHQTNAANPEWQQELNVKAMTKAEFLQVWQPAKKTKKGCCS